MGSTIIKHYKMLFKVGENICRKAQRKEAQGKECLSQCFDAKIVHNWYGLESDVFDKDFGLQP